MLKHRGASDYVAQVQAEKVIDGAVRREANVMAYNDAFLLMALVLFSASIGAFFLKKGPTGGHALVE
jgi:hypothetical protein